MDWFPAFILGFGVASAIGAHIWGRQIRQLRQRIRELERQNSTAATSEAMRAAQATLNQVLQQRQEQRVSQEIAAAQQTLAAVSRPPAFQLDLNTAGVEELDQLPGIGTKMAEAIIRLRTRLGGFRNHEQLTDIRGINARLLQRIRPHLLPIQASSAPPVHRNARAIRLNRNRSQNADDRNSPPE